MFVLYCIKAHEYFMQLQYNSVENNVIFTPTYLPDTEYWFILTHDTIEYIVLVAALFQLVVCKLLATSENTNTSSQMVLV